MSRTSPLPGSLPPNFVFGAATSAFQIEGGRNADGKADSIWDTFCDLPGATADGDSGTVACDHYHRSSEDLQIMQTLGLDAYRFSIAWARIMPDGRTVNSRGLDFYERLIDGLLERGIEPWPTLYHWDLPQSLQDQGGWVSRDSVDWFTDYAEAVQNRLGARVKRYTTFNEPWCAAFLGHAAGVHAPGMQNPSGAIAAAHHMLLSHGRVAQLLHSTDPDMQVGITLNLSVIDPLTPSDEQAARMIDGQINRFFLDPLFRGEYPADVRGMLAEWWPSDLVQDDDLSAISAPLDFLGVNYYRGEVVSLTPPPEDETLSPPTDRPPASPYLRDEGIHFHTVLPERTSLGWVIQPEGLTRLLKRISTEYAKPSDTPLFVTENGAAFNDVVDHDGQVHDEIRVRYVEDHIGAVFDARNSGVDVRGYFYWSLLDNFEWDWGYSQRFGIVHVDYRTQARTIKQSGLRYAEIIAQSHVG